VAQVVSALGQSIGQRLGWDLECAQIGPASNPTQISYECSAEVVFGADQVYPMTVALSSGLVLAIKESLEEKESSEEAAPAPVADDDRFSMISDVELPVSVSFGRTHLPIRDVLKLNTGSLVELNRMINDTVDIIVNNCVIARGEVVVIDGNYGVRIHQIVSKQERLAVRHNRGSSLTATA
jgi:flagellar motor switch protein FliN/FliY